MRRRLTASALAAVLLLGGAACSGSDDAAAPAATTLDPSDPLAVVLVAATKLDDQPALRFELRNTNDLLFPPDGGVVCGPNFPTGPVVIGLDLSTGTIWTEDANDRPDVIYADRATFVRADLLSTGAPTPWVRFDEDDAGRVPTSAVRFIGPPWIAVPAVDHPFGRLSSTISLAESAAAAEREVIDGTETTRYVVTIPGRAFDEMVARLADESDGGSTPSSASPDSTLDVWITDDGAIRRVDQPDQGTSAVFDGVSVEPALTPDDADVTDALDLSLELPESQVLESSAGVALPCTRG